MSRGFESKVHFSLRCRAATAEVLGAVPVGPCTVPGFLEACKEYAAAKGVTVIAVQTPDGPRYLWPLRGAA